MSLIFLPPAGAFSMRQIIRFTYVNHFKPILPLWLRCAYNKLLFEKNSLFTPSQEAVSMANCAIVGINWGDEGKGRMVDYLIPAV